MRYLLGLLVCVAACGGGATQNGDGGAGSGDMAVGPGADLSSSGGGDLASTGDGGTDTSGKSLGSCPIFPADNPWNTDVSGYPVDPSSDAYITAMNGHTKNLHPDFGSDPSYGIPWISVAGTQPKVPMTFQYADESDPGPYPFPSSAPIEGGTSASGDRHVIVIDRDNCLLYETFDSHYVGPGWMCGSGALFNLQSNQLRPDGWTSADAAGLAIFPGLVRLDEAKAGAIHHAIRVTFDQTQAGYIHPATHFASSSTDPSLPPMGLRLRMRAGYDTSGLTGLSKAIADAFKKYGMIVADNGSDWYFGGETNTAWDDNDLGQLKSIPGDAFEVVQTGAIQH